MANKVSFLIEINDNGGAKRVSADAELGRVIRSVQDESEKLKRDILTWSQASQAVEALQSSVSNLQGVMADFTAAYQVQLVAETQLNTIMRQRMAATDAEIQSVKDLCSAQQELGVVGDEVQLSGAQQMATFLSERQSLETLIPAMNNLIAQQNGLNATNQDAVSIGNMMGKAMQGQSPPPVFPLPESVNGFRACLAHAAGILCPGSRAHAETPVSGCLFRHIISILRSWQCLKRIVLIRSADRWMILF